MTPKDDVVIDLRSDTVTRPTEPMRRAIASAEVGDDVFGDDPTVNRLEAMVAERLGTEASLFVTSGTQSNLCALLAHCGRGDEYIAGDSSHTFRLEAGGGAVLGGIAPQPVATETDGLPSPEAVTAAVKPDDTHFARTRLLCLENTKNGIVQSPQRMDQAIKVARDADLGVHLDGARMWNACVELGVSGGELGAGCDTVSMCLSKGLGAPAGSILSGPRALIDEARKWRKMLGGGLRQAGVLAAAGIYALENNVDRLADDHARAALLAEGLADIDGIKVNAVNTNMMFISIDGADSYLQQRLADRGVLCDILRSRDHKGPSPYAQVVGTRLVTHLGISDNDVHTAAAAFAAALGDSG